MNRIRQSIAWWCFVPELLTPEQLVRAAAEIGYDALELVDAEYWPLAREHGLAIASMRGHESLIAGLNRREHHDHIEREIRSAIRAAEQWNIPNIICFSGNRNGVDDRIGAEITAEGLRRVAGTAEDAGVTLVLELLNSRIDHPDYQCDHTSVGCRSVSDGGLATGEIAV